VFGMKNSPVRILHVMDSLGNGGLENGVLNLIKHMDAGQFEHFICTVRAQGVNAERLNNERVRLVHLGKRMGSHFQFLGLRRAIRESRPDIVHSRNWGAIEAVIAARLAGSCAVIHSEHGFEAGAAASEPWRRVAFRRLAFELADGVLCVSRQLRDFHARSTAFPARRIKVIHNGVDSRRFCPDPAARARVRRELEIGENEFCIGCVGNLVPVKDHRTLLQALEELGEAAKGWHMLVAGEGPERPKLEAAACELSQRWTRISFLGTSLNVPELLNSFDVYVLPSLNEGISNSLLEAMATGLPVIASDAGGNPEVVEDGISGLIFPAGDVTRLAEQLLRLQARDPFRVELGSAARRRVREEFSIDSMVQNYERLYRSLSPAALSAHAEAGA
jgi:sugar transferase (PEP-CTERM/EpsH1 system associated)